MQQKLDAIEKEKHEPIAIIGMGCRFPGANNPEEFWQLLAEGKNAITETPKSHWDIQQYCNDGVNTPGKICNSYGIEKKIRIGLLDQIVTYFAFLPEINPLCNNLVKNTQIIY